MADAVNHPPHYTEGFKTKQIECFDIAKHMDFAWGNAFKYVWRAGKKGGFKKAMEDLDKAEWYIENGWGDFRVGDEAKAIFRLLEPPKNGLESARYDVLKNIVFEQTVSNFEELRNLLEEAMEDNEDENH